MGKYGPEIKNEVIRYMEKLSGETHTSLAWNRDLVSGSTYDFRFKERHSDYIIARIEINFNEVDDIFEAMHAVREEVIKKVTEYRNSSTTPMIGRDISEYLKIDVEQAKRIDKMVRNSVFGSAVYKPTARVWRTYASGQTIPEIENVIFNNPATIVFWNDGTKTVVKAQDDDVFDPEKGLAMAIAKKAFGNHGNYCNKLKPWLEEYEESLSLDINVGCSMGEALKDLSEKVSKTARKFRLMKEAAKTHSNIWTAYHRLCNALHDKKATKADLGAAMEEAIGYLGEELDN